MIAPTLRAALVTDLAAVRDLLVAAALPVDGLADQFPHAYAVAEQDGAVVGAAGVERYGQSGLLRSLVVGGAARSSGIGARLVEEVLGRARQDGLESVYALTTTAAGYLPRFGFTVVERDSAPAEVQASRELASVCPASAVCLRLETRPRGTRTS